MPIIKLANGASGEPSGEIEITRQPEGHVLLRIRKHHEVSIKLSRSISRRMSELFAEEAGPSRPKLEVVSKPGEKANDEVR